MTMDGWGRWYWGLNEFVVSRGERNTPLWTADPHTFRAGGLDP